MIEKMLQPKLLLVLIGAGDGIRTHGLDLGKVAL